MEWLSFILGNAESTVLILTHIAAWISKSPLKNKK